MSRIEIPDFSERWNTADLVKWINSRQESVGVLLGAVEAEITEAQNSLMETRNEIESLKNDESGLEECSRSCVELRERLKMVVDAQAKEYLVKEFDAIAIYDKADSRASDLVKILMARKLWKENVAVIENMGGNEPASEDIIFNLQKAYESLSEFHEVPERERFLEKVKDVFLSWYSTRIVLALQSEAAVDALLTIKQKYEGLRRTEDFNNAIKHYIKDQNRFHFQAADNLSDLFLNMRSGIISNYKNFLDGWAEKVLDKPNVFIANVFIEDILAQEETVRSACINTIGRTVEDDPSGSQTLKMILEFKTTLSQYMSQPDDEAITPCIAQLGELLLFYTAGEYTKLTTSFVASCSNISMDSPQISVCLEQLSNGVSQLIQESDYLMQTAKETFDNIAIIFLVPAFRTMYGNVLSLLTKFYKTHLERNNVKDDDVLRVVSILGQLITWTENDKQRLKDMVDQLGTRGADPIVSKLSQKMTNEISSFQSKLSVKAEGDISLAKGRSEMRKMNKRFIARAVEVLSRTLVTDMGNGLQSIMLEKNVKNADVQRNIKVPSFGTSPNEFVTATGVALLSLAHQLSAYSQDSNMASAIASAAKLEIVEDIPSWWVGKCAVAVQECFIDTVGDIAAYPDSLCQKLSVDYAYLDDVFEDLGTTKTSDFVNMRQSFVRGGYLESQ